MSKSMEATESQPWVRKRWERLYASGFDSAGELFGALHDDLDLEGVDENHPLEASPPSRYEAVVYYGPRSYLSPGTIEALIKSADRAKAGRPK